LIPLRVLPSVILSLILYPMAGLQMKLAHFIKFMLALVLFNVTSASLVIMISAMFTDVVQITLVSTTTILIEMLFGGLLLSNYNNKFVIVR